MSNNPRIYTYTTLRDVTIRFRDDLNNHNYVLLYAYNGTGKTRLSMEFKNRGKQLGSADTLYFNAFTEDLFSWDNDLDNDLQRVLKINSQSNFFNGFKELALEEKIFSYLERYAEFDFKIDYENWTVTFSRGEHNHIKVSRGEENVFIWCVFLSICELAIDDDGSGPYNFVKYFYIDDPISSLDDNNAIAIASDLSQLLKKGNGKIKTVISSHHSLFFNVMCNELKKTKHTRYFLHKNGVTGYTLQKTDDTPFFHHVALITELKKASDTDNIKTYHFNVLRSILEKTSSFFGYNDFNKCIQGIEDDVLFERALNLLSHGKYSIYEPVDMGDDTKELFKRILDAFLEKYHFELPILVNQPAVAEEN